MDFDSDAPNNANSPQGLVQELEANEARYRSLFGLNPDPTFVIDRDGLIVTGNNALETITGYALNELLRRPFTDLLLPSDREHALRHLRRALSGVGQVFEVTGVNHDSREFHISLSVFPLRDRGEIVGVYGLGRNMSEQKEAERALRDSEERYRMLAEHVQDLISLHDLDGRFLYATPSAHKLLGVHPVELIGQSVYDMVVAEDVGALREAHRDILARQGKAPLAFRAHRPDGTTGWFETTARVTEPDATGERRIVSVTRDISERRSLEHRLMQAEKLEAIGRLAGGIAHDFNNILTVISGQAALALSMVPSDEREIAGSLDEIVEAASRATALTAQLLTFGKRQMTRPQTLDVNAAVLGLLTLMRRLLREDIVIDTSLAADLAAVRLDPAQMEQVLINLVVNARDAMPDGGTVNIATWNSTPEDVAAAAIPSGNYVVLRVSDNGSGMDEDTARRAFEPFFSSKGQAGGTGLGLPTVHGIVEQAGGFVTLTSAPGEGTVVTAYLLRSAESAQSAAPAGASVAPANLGGTEVILLAEDDAGVRGLAHAVLQRYGYTVIAAASGAEAIALFEGAGGKVDLLLSDVIMPNMRGPELVTELRRRNPALPVLFISGYTADALMRDGIGNGDIEVLGKPFRPDVLALRVRQLLDRMVVRA